MRTGGTGIKVSVKASATDARRIKKKLRSIGSEQRNVVREELKRWGRETRAAVRAATPKHSGLLKRAIATKFKTYRGGAIFWSAVGGKILKKSIKRERYKFKHDHLGAGWRIHFVTGPRRRRQAKDVSTRPEWY